MAPVPVTGLTANFSPVPRMAPQPVGMVTDGSRSAAACGPPTAGLLIVPTAEPETWLGSRGSDGARGVSWHSVAISSAKRAPPECAPASLFPGSPTLLLAPLYASPRACQASLDGLMMGVCQSGCQSDESWQRLGRPKIEYGGSGIRTHGGLHPSGFQSPTSVGVRHRPLRKTLPLIVRRRSPTFAIVRCGCRHGCRHQPQLPRLCLAT
jgi:hypothetical protein